MAKLSSCFFCQNKVEPDYKEADNLKQFISSRGKILGRTKTDICRRHQKKLATAIKRARHLALLAFITRAKWVLSKLKQKLIEFWLILTYNICFQIYEATLPLEFLKMSVQFHVLNLIVLFTSQNYIFEKSVFIYFAFINRFP